MIAESTKSAAARFLALVLALAAAPPRGGFAYDSGFQSEKARLQYQREEEIRAMQRREEDAKYRISKNRTQGEAEVAEIREILAPGRTAVASATALAKTLAQEKAAPLPPDLQAAGRNCRSRMAAVERRLAEEDAKLHSPDFVSEKVVAALADLKHDARSAAAEARRLLDAVERFQGGYDEKARLRKLRLLAVAAAAVFAAAFVAALFFARSRKADSGRARVVRGPLRTVHSFPNEQNGN